MKSDRLVQALVDDLRPVHRLRRPEHRALLWGGFALACVALGALALHLRADLVAKLRQPSYLLENGSLLLLAALAARGAFRLSVPGLVRGRIRRLLPALGVLLWGSLVAIRTVREPHAVIAGASFVLTGVPCVIRMTALGLVPGLALVRMLRRAAPLHTAWAGLWALVATSSLAMLGTQLLCPKDGSLHVLVWHVAPVLLSGLLGVTLGRRWLRSYPIVSSGNRAPA